MLPKEGLAAQMQSVWSGDGPQLLALSGSTWLQADGCSKDMPFPGQPAMGTEPSRDIHAQLFWSNMAQL